VDTLVKFSIIVASLLAGFGVFYHYVIYLPDVDAQRKAFYVKCQKGANENYKSAWAAACKAQAQGPNCSLPAVIADSHNKDRETALQQCLAEAKLF
jgi:invasion protein IalB